jgi:hypothetical protein
MKALRFNGSALVPWAVVGWLVVGAANTAAQQPPPIAGTTASMVLEGTMKKVYAGAHTVIVSTIDGVEHVVHFTTDLVVHGGRGSGVDALPGLHEGSTVVVHYTMRGNETSVQEIDNIGDEGLKVTEGTVSRLNRRRKEITIRFDNGTTEVLRLTDRAAAEIGPDAESSGDGTRATVYYSDERGHKVAHFFKKVTR